MSLVNKEAEKKGKTTESVSPTTISWQERKNLADEEAEALEKKIQDLQTWTKMIESLNEDQLKEYLKNRPDELKRVKMHKSAPRQRIPRAEAPKHSTSKGIMASVWKFHK